MVWVRARLDRWLPGLPVATWVATRATRTSGETVVGAGATGNGRKGREGGWHDWFLESVGGGGRVGGRLGRERPRAEGDWGARGQHWGACRPLGSGAHVARWDAGRALSVWQLGSAGF